MEELQTSADLFRFTATFLSVFVSLYAITSAFCLEIDKCLNKKLLTYKTYLNEIKQGCNDDSIKATYTAFKKYYDKFKKTSCRAGIIKWISMIAAYIVILFAIFAAKSFTDDLSFLLLFISAIFSIVVILIFIILYVLMTFNIEHMDEHYNVFSKRAQPEVISPNK